MRFIPPISTTEFFHHLQRCIPPTGWPAVLSVANSGGPDSTALLFLLTAVIRQRAGFDGHPHHEHTTGHGNFPREVVSLHVNHDLQAAANTMEQIAASNAEKLGVPSISEKISWGLPPFLTRPGEGVVGERLAREARYNKLFAAMQKARTDVIALAHHADDQVETTVMRMSQGSSARGLAGMRPVRRWGMGQKDNELASYGVQGMYSWIVRPFLGVSKDRLLATCDANGLNYVNDPTNFQPGITVRNTIRHHLTPNEQNQNDEPHVESLTFDVAPHVKTLRAMVPDTPPADQLREAVRLYGIRLEEVDTQVTNVFAQARIPSPPSTLLLNCAALSAAATDDDVRIALVRRSLRYLSHGPWGSPWAEARGERDVLQRIASELWAPRDPTRERRQFTAAAGVTAIPVAIKLNDGKVRFRPALSNEEEGWILARIAPYQRAGSPPDPLHAGDVTEGVLAAIQDKERMPLYSKLYDNRFIVNFDLRLLPQPVEDEIVIRGARVVIEPDTKWMLPKVVLGGWRTTHRDMAKFLWYLKGWTHTCKRPVKHQRWIKMDFVRSLDAI